MAVLAFSFPLPYLNHTLLTSLTLTHTFSFHYFLFLISYILCNILLYEIEISYCQRYSINDYGISCAISYVSLFYAANYFIVIRNNVLLCSSKAQPPTARLHGSIRNCIVFLHHFHYRFLSKLSHIQQYGHDQCGHQHQ